VDRSNGKFYTGSYDSVINRWDVETGAPDKFQGQGHANQITRMAVQGNNLVTCSMDDSARVTPLDTLEYAAEKIGVDSPPPGVAAVRNGDLAIVPTMKKVNLLRNGAIKGTIDVAFEPSSVAVNSAGTEVAVGGKDKKIHIFSVSGDSLSESKVLEGHRGEVSAVAYSDNDARLASADSMREILVWKDGEVEVRGWVHHTARINALAWSPDNDHLASGALDQQAIVWNCAETSKRVHIANCHKGGVNDVAWLDENTLLTTGQDCSTKSWVLKF